MNLKRVALPAFALLLGLTLALVLAALLGENPWFVLGVLARGALGSATDRGYSLYYATPLLFTGLAVAWGLKAGLFNIGAEGQMLVGGVAIAAVGIGLPNLPGVIALPLGCLAAFVAGGVWGLLAGWLKAQRLCHEVLTTILLNFVAYGLTTFIILQVLKNPNSQVPETSEVGPGFSVAALGGWLGGSSPANWTLALGLAASAAFAVIMLYSRFGFHQRLVGGAPRAAWLAGLAVNKQIMFAMFISGGLAGLAAVSPVLGFALKVREGFSANAGFVGVAVALLGRGSAVGIVGAALLFGALTKGALDLDLDTHFISRDLALVIQALIVLLLAGQNGLLALWQALLCWVRT